MKDKNQPLSSWITIWTFGFLGGLLFRFFVWIRLIKLQGYDIRKFIPQDKGIIAYYRHPSLLEPSLLPFLLFPKFLRDLRLVPISTPDKRNYYQRWWFRLFREFSVPINRGMLKESDAALRELTKLLNQKIISLLAPSGGREWKGTEFKRIIDGNIETVRISANQDFRALSKEADGRLIRRFKPGIAQLLINTQAAALPIWVEIKWKARLIIKIGEPFVFPASLTRDEIVGVLEDRLLALRGEK